MAIFKSMLGLGELRTGEASAAKAGQEVVWTAEAREQLGKIPFFVRKMAKQRIEEEARKKGLSEITIELMLEVKEKMGR
jgi:light-independent protochlorophyllide reductase subunit B